MNTQLQGDVRAANVAKLTYQATRAARGVATASKFTAAFDLAAGVTNMANAGNVGQAIMGAGGTARAASSLTGLTGDAEVVNFASKVLPFVGKAMGGLGLAMAGLELGKGANELLHGENARAQDHLVDGAADTITSGALTFAGTAAASGFGAPVAAVALGVAAVSSAAKLGYDFRHSIGGFAEKAGALVTEGFTKLTGATKPA